MRGIRSLAPSNKRRIARIVAKPAQQPVKESNGGGLGWIKRSDRRPDLGPKIISLSPWQYNPNQEGYSTPATTLYGFSRLWSVRFAALDTSNVYIGESGQYSYRKYAGTDRTDEEIIASWLEIPKDTRLRVWTAFALRALKSKQRYALRLLAATMLHPELAIPRYMIDDCLYHLTKFFLAYRVNPDQDRVADIHGLLCDFIRASSAGVPFRLNDTTVYWVLKHCTDKEANGLFEAIHDSSVRLHGHTWNHMLGRFAGQNNIAACLHILDRITAADMDLQSSPIMGACCKLLRARTGTKEWYQVQSTILSRILELGVRPNLSMWNAMLCNAAEAGDHSTAWNMYEIGRQNNLTPDGVTFRTMLLTAQNSLEKNMLDKIIDHAEHYLVVPTDQMTVFHILYSVFVMEASRNLNRPFNLMLEVYQRWFDTALLVDLGMCFEQDTSPKGALQGHHCPESEEIQRERSSSSPEVATPHPAIIGIMIMGYLRQNARSDPAHLLDLYNCYRQMAETTHPIISHIPRTTHVGNAFMHVLQYHKENLRFLTTIITHMEEQRDVQSRKHVVARYQDKSSGKPDVTTYNICMHAALRHRQTRAVERIGSRMKQMGLKYDKVTWNTIIGGYAKTQDIDATMDAVRGMKAQKFRADEYTIKGLDRLHDREAVTDALSLWSQGNEAKEHSSMEHSGVMEVGAPRGREETLGASYAERRRRERE